MVKGSTFGATGASTEESLQTAGNMERGCCYTRNTTIKDNTETIKKMDTERKILARVCSILEIIRIITGMAGEHSTKTEKFIMRVSGSTTSRSKKKQRQRRLKPISGNPSAII